MPAHARAKPLDMPLIERVLAGDPRATGRLVRMHNRLLYRTARAILRDDHEAEDAVQDAYIRAFRALHRFEGKSALSTWLVRIVANESFARRKRIARRAAAIPTVPDGYRDATHVADKSPSPEMAAMHSQARRRMQACIDALPAWYRSVFVMIAVREMTTAQVAQALDIPEATVRTRYFRARASLRRALSDAGLDRLDQAN